MEGGSRRLKRREDPIRLGLGGDADLLAVYPDETGREFRPDPVGAYQRGGDGPVFRRDEGPDVFFAVHHQA